MDRLIPVRDGAKVARYEAAASSGRVARDGDSVAVKYAGRWYAFAPESHTAPAPPPAPVVEGDDR